MVRMERIEEVRNVLNDDVLRVALYIRVSSAEQATHGYSLAAQESYLREYAKQHKMRIVGVYADEGKSASKALHKRTALLQMIEDMEAGDLDAIVFKDITRWSRNSAQYFRIQERIDAAGGYWIAAQQPYLETKTPTGRYQVTVMLGNSQLEAEMTAERIRFTNASRLPQKGVLYGAQSCPLGYTVREIDGNKYMVKDETEAHLVHAIFDYYETHGSIRGTLRFMAEHHDYRMEETSLRKMLKNTLYKGEYKGVDDYCEPYMTAARWESIQKIRKRRNYTPTDASRVYMFSSLLRCKECGKNLTAFHSTYKGKPYVYYRCKNYTIYKKCPHKKGTREDVMEKWLLENIADEMSKYVHQVKVENAAPPDTAKKRKSIENKAKNLRELYIDGDIDKAEYTRRKTEYEAQLSALPVYEVRNTRDIEDFLNSDWRTLYESLQGHEKRAFWQSIIDYIEIDNEQTKRPHFFE